MDHATILSKVIALVAENLEVEEAELTEASRFEELGAETLVMNAGVMTIWAGGRNREVSAASVTTELVTVGVENEWEETVGTKRLPATLVADGEWCGAAAVMEDEALLMMIKGLLDGFD